MARRTMVSPEEAVGLTVASVEFRSDAETEIYGEEIVIHFQEGKELVVWGCGCCPLHVPEGDDPAVDADG